METSAALIFQGLYKLEIGNNPSTCTVYAESHQQEMLAVISAFPAQQICLDWEDGTINLVVKATIRDEPKLLVQCFDLQANR